MKKIIILFLFVIFLTPSFAEIVNEIEIKGTKRVSPETVIVYGKIKKGENYNDKDLNQIFNNLESTNFFEDINLQIKNGVLIIKLKEYPLISSLTIEGEPTKRISKEIKKFIKSKEKGSFVKSFINEDIESIKKIYSSIGYNLAEVDIKTKEIDKDTVDILIEISRGEISRIKKIKFIGDKKIKDRRLRDIIASEEDKFWKVFSNNSKFNENIINLDKNLLRNYYKSMGYYNVEVVSSFAEISEDGEVEITYSIDAGKRFVVSKISTDIDPSIDKKIFSDLSKSYKELLGDFYSPFKVRKLLDRVGELVSNKDLQFIEYKVGEKIGDDTIELTIKIFEGERILVERINILGNDITSESVIRSELELDEGDPFDKVKLSKSIANLKSRNIFRDVNYQLKNGSETNTKILDISIEEKPTGEISAGLGVGTEGTSIAFSVVENNWLGQGKRVKAQADIDEESISGVLSFFDPNYNFLGNGLNYYISSQTSDKPDQGYENSLVTLGLGTSFEQYRNVEANLGLFAAYDDLSTTSDASDSLKKQAGEYNEFGVQYGFTFDKRDRKFMPTSGTVNSFNQKLPILADKQYIKNSFSSSSYKSFSPDAIGAIKFYAAHINGLSDDDVRLSNRLNISSKRLRGFKKGKVGPKDSGDFIGGNYVTALNLETTLPTVLPENMNTDLLLFLDMANLWGVDYDSSLDESNEIRSSFGLAASWLSPVGPMTFTLAENITKADTDQTQGFTFRLGTTF